MTAGALAATRDDDRRQEIILRYGRDLIRQSNRYAVLMDSMGLTGPFN